MYIGKCLSTMFHYNNIPRRAEQHTCHRADRTDTNASGSVFVLMLLSGQSCMTGKLAPPWEVGDQWSGLRAQYRQH